MHFNGRFVLNLAKFAEMQGANMHRLLRHTGKSIEELSSEHCRLGYEAYNRFLEDVVASTKDELFGLHAGENLSLQAAGLIVQIANSCDTVKKALEYCCEFANLGCSALPTRLTEEATHYKLTLNPDTKWRQQSEKSVLHTVFGYMAFMIKEFQSLTFHKHYPKEVWLDTPPVTNTEEFQRVVGCPALFLQPKNAILFHKVHVEEKVVTSDYALFKVLIAHAQEKSAQLHNASSHSFYHKVKQSILHLVKPSFPTIEQIAAHLNMSVRTFQRRLKEEGFSYKILIDDLRKDFAIDYLKNQELSIGEISYLLDYSDPSTFIRSFKRWTGMTPNTYRKELMIR